MNGQELKLDHKWKWVAKNNDGLIFAYTYMPTFDGYFWQRNCGIIVVLPICNELGEPADSLHQIIDGKLVKYVDIPADGEKVIVWCENSKHLKRYSAGRIDCDGWLLCYDNGKTNWSNDGHGPTPWHYRRRPTAEELAE